MNRIVYLMAEGFGQAAQEFFFKQRHEAFLKTINAIFADNEEDRPEMIVVGSYYDHKYGEKSFRTKLDFEKQLEQVYDMVCRFDADVTNKSDFYGCLQEFHEHSDTQFQILTR